MSKLLLLLPDSTNQYLEHLLTIVKPICVVLKHSSHDLYTVWTRDPFSPTPLEQGYRESPTNNKSVLGNS